MIEMEVLMASRKPIGMRMKAGGMMRPKSRMGAMPVMQGFKNRVKGFRPKRQGYGRKRGM